MLPIAIQLYTVRDQAAADFEGTLRAIKAKGYEGVEFAGLYGKTPAEVKALCAEIGLTPISAHVPYYDMIADPKGVLADYAAIGCRYVAIPYLTPECRPGTDGFAKVVENAEMLGKVAKELGMTIIDAGHFHTENPAMYVMAEKLKQAFPDVEVVLSQKHTDCMKFY